MTRPIEDSLEDSDIQGDILEGLPKRSELLIFFTISHVQLFKFFLKTLDVTNLETVLGWKKIIKQRKDKGIETLLPTPGLNVAFTYNGLVKLGVQGLHGNNDLAEFEGGMASRTAILGDPAASGWKILRGSTAVHGVFIVTGASAAEVANVVSLSLSPAATQGWGQFGQPEIGTVRPDPIRGHEHFGYADGVSQPGVRGTVASTGLPLMASNSKDEDQGQLGQDLLWPGLFVLGYHGQDATAADFTVKGPVTTPPVPMMKNGAFLVFRRLAQAVPEFNAAVNSLSQHIPPTAEPASPQLLGAQMIGRWKSGAPLVIASIKDDPTLADGTEGVNDFEFTNDREGIKCPFAAHVRKVYPRNDIFPLTDLSEATVNQAEAQTQTHRMMRRGIAFGPELSLEEASSGVSNSTTPRGLLFKCYVTSLKDQFEFVQESWVNSFDFNQPASGFDPIISQVNIPEKPFLGACPVTGDISKRPQLLFPSFVHMDGGEYFFSPSLSALKAF